MIDLRVKKLFFDRPKVQRAVGAANRRALSKVGAFIRQRAKTSIRKRKGAAPPGRPPHSHTGLLRRFIFFGYDPRKESVVIGPARLNRGTRAPHTLEFGGNVVTKRALLVRVGDTGRDRRGRFKRGKRRLVKKGTKLIYKPRPFMGPALEKERPKLPKLWANSVRS
ncbi:MAG: hypothetical protein GY842_27530 [bacterium]|nr:hypothetical protein [bacterium]